MPKRKAGSEGDSEAQFTDESSEGKKKAKLSSKRTKQVRTDASPADTPPPNRNGATISGSVSVQKSSEGDRYIELGKKKRATVRSFKGTLYLDIREFYIAGSEEKPGKKGISLTAEQWRVLKANTDVIDELLAELSSKK